MNPDPTRLIGEPMMGMGPVAITRSPTGIALLGQKVVRIASAAQALSGALGGIFATFLPAPWAVTACAICGGVFAVATVITGAGPGVRTDVGPAPIVQAPRIGPPQ